MDIQAAIGVHDAFSEPLRNMSNALNMTISSFEQLQDTSSNAVDLTSLQQARNELAKAEVGFNKIGDEIREAEERQRKFNEEIEQANAKTEKLYSTFKRVVAIIGVGKLFKDGFDVYKGFNQEMANLQAVTMATAYEMEALNYTAKMMGETTIFSAGQGAEGMKELAKGGLKVYEIIESIPHVLDLAAISQMELGQAAGITVDIMRGFNLEASEMKRVVDLIAYTSSNATTDVNLMGETFGYAAKVADTFNASIEETAALIGMMSTAAKGSKAGMALRAGFGRMASPTGEAEKWAEALEINFTDPATKQLRNVTDIVDDLAVAFEDMTNAQQIQASKAIFGEQAYNAWLAVIQQGKGAMDEWLDAFNREAIDTAEKMKEIMLNTTDGILQLHKSEVESIWINFYEGLADGVVNDAFQSVLSGMRTALEIGLTLATGVITAIGYGIQFIADNLEILVPLLVIAATVWVVLNGEMLIGLGIAIKDIAIKAAQAIAYGVLTAATMVQATATFFLTWATQGLSAALMATPIGWVIAGIVIIIGVIYAAVGAFNRLAGASLSATGIIIGALSVLGAFIFNLFFSVFDFIWNIGVTLVNGFISFAEFLVNVFINPINAIANLFVDLGDFVLGILESIASAIDFIFGSNLAGAVEGWRSNLKGWVENHIESNAVEFDRVDVDHGIDRINYGDAWNKGYDLGANLGNKVSDFFSFGTDDFDMDKFMSDQMGGLDGLGSLDPNTPGGIGSDIKDIAGNTKDINDKLKATDEDIKYLRDLASNAVINRFTTNHIEVTQHNDMKVDNKLDLDGIFNDLADGVEETLDYRMEGI